MNSRSIVDRLNASRSQGRVYAKSLYRAVACGLLMCWLSGCAVYTNHSIHRHRLDWNTERAVSLQCEVHEHLPPRPVRGMMFRFPYNVGCTAGAGPTLIAPQPSFVATELPIETHQGHPPTEPSIPAPYAAPLVPPVEATSPAFESPLNDPRPNDRPPAPLIPPVDSTPAPGNLPSPQADQLDRAAPPNWPLPGTTRSSEPAEPARSSPDSDDDSRPRVPTAGKPPFERISRSRTIPQSPGAAHSTTQHESPTSPRKKSSGAWLFQSPR